MFPWWWFWAPQVRFPLSGSLAQRIEPNTNWFFDGIRPEAGIGDVEKEIFENVASYGRQLGLIIEVLLGSVKSGAIDSQDAAKSLERLEDIYRQTEQVKSESSSRLAAAAIALLDKLHASDREQIERVLRHFANHAED